MAKPGRPSKRRSSAVDRRSAASKSTVTGPSVSGAGLQSIIWGLLLARWLMPTEGTVEGDTLWLTSLTLAAAAGCFWWNSRISLERFRFGKTDLAVWLFCGVHALASLRVILTEGNQRAATNMLWEWLGVALAFSLVRQSISPQTRDRFLRTVLVMATALACYGIWQPLFWYPANLREYEALRTELESVESAVDLSVQERARRQLELRAEFVAQGIPLSGPSQQLFERRLRDSTEPLGFFALANTFAGLLASSLVLLAGMLLHRLLPRGNVLPSQSASECRRRVTCAIGGAALLVAYCLVLTKSRTAWGGTLVGSVVLIGLVIVVSRSGSSLRKLVPIVAVGVAVLTLLVVAGAATGALDIEVLSEASMSLRYRFDYWTSTWEVIQEHPFFGTGPGNFRDHYLKFKLPRSSEEIADPHQFVLDVIANAGLAGAIGLAVLLGMIARLIWQRCFQRQGDDQAVSSGQTSATDIAATDSSHTASRSAVAVAALVTTAGAWLFSGTFSWLVTCVCLLAIGIDVLLQLLAGSNSADSDARCDSWHVPSVAVVAAIVAMFVHLSAAGGIAMPAVSGFVFALVAVLQADCRRTEDAIGGHSDDRSRISQKRLKQSPDEVDLQGGRWAGAALFSGLMAVGCTLTAFGPVIRASSLLQLGDFEAVNGQPLRQVAGLYRSAADADTLWAEPHIRLSQIYLHHWKQTDDANYFEESIEHAEEARSISPDAPHITHEIGFAWLMRARRSAAPADIAAAVEELQKALSMYPTHPVWNAELAQALKLSGDAESAADVARRTLELERVNRESGHADRYLPKELLEEIEQIAGTR